MLLRVKFHDTGVCAADEEENAGLCYKNCSDESFDGVGPVCWQGAPPIKDGVEWVECGMGFASSDLKCGTVTGNQVWSVIASVINIATLGAGAAVTKAVDAGLEAAIQATEATASVLDATEEVTDTIMSAVGVLEDAVTANDAMGGDSDLDYFNTYVQSVSGFNVMGAVDTMIGIADGEDLTSQDAGLMVDTAIEIAKYADPTGISGVVDAYLFPTCDCLSDAGFNSYTICKAGTTGNLCMRATGGEEGMSEEEDLIRLSETQSENQELAYGSFQIIPLEDDPSYVMLCVSGSSAPGDDGCTDLCLHAWGGSKSDKLIKLYNGQEYNSEQPNGLFKITPISEGSKYNTICVSGKNSRGDGTDLCLHAVGGGTVKLKFTKNSNKGRGNGRFKIEHINDGSNYDPDA